MKQSLDISKRENKGNYTLYKKEKLFLKASFLSIIILAFSITLLAQPNAAQATQYPPFPTTYYLHKETSARTANSWQLQTGGPNQFEDTTSSVKPKKNTNEFQWWPGIPNRTTSGQTNGYGWFYDTDMDGYYLAGTWTFYVRLSNAGTSATGVVRAYVKRYNGASYTNLFTATSGNITPTTTMTTYSFTASPGTVDLGSGNYLYVHYTWQLTTALGENDTVIAFGAEGSDISPASDQPRIETPTDSVSTMGYFLLAISLTFFIVVLVKKRILFIRGTEA